jgi:pimeloyl-ACP methyl ester carboxylesterase
MWVQDIFGADRRPPLRALDKPALIIAAAKGPLFDLQKEEAATIPTSKFVTVENSGHAIMVDLARPVR